MYGIASFHRIWYNDHEDNIIIWRAVHEKTADSVAGICVDDFVLFWLLCDDTKRDYGDEAEAAEFAEKCAALGFETISMRDEFTTIYADTIVKAEANESEALKPAA